jgi:cell division septation protein DedD
VIDLRTQPVSAEGKTRDPARSEPKVEVKTAEVKPVPIAPEHSPIRAPDGFTGEQVAFAKDKLANEVPAKKAVARSRAKTLEGYIIQIAFADKESAQHWAETLERRGYAVSVTEATGTGSLRVRIGNFALHDDAEGQLRKLRQEGLIGMIINLPQGYHPEARPLEDETSSKENAVSP